MDVHGLRAFLEVADCDSFSAAAERLLITQPAISKRVANLEGQLGIRLFDRVGKRVLLTEAGRALLPQARKILMEIAEAGKIVANLAEEVQGELTIATSHHIGLHRLPEPLRLFARRYPAVRLHVHFTDSDRGVRMVVDGDCDVGVVTLPEAVPEKLVVKPLWRDTMAIMVASHHSLAGESVSPASLSGQPVILPAQTTTTSTIIQRSLEVAGVRPEQIEVSQDYETIRMLVSVGMGWSVLPESMASEPLCCCQLAGFSCSRNLGVLYHGQRLLSNAARAFIELLQQGEALL